MTANSDTTNTHTSLPHYLIRFIQAHETFRLPELEALSSHLNTPITILDYSPTSPFCAIQFDKPSSNPEDHHALAKCFISRAILAKAIHELYSTSPSDNGSASYDDLHINIKALPAQQWEKYRNVSFKFSIDAFCGKRSTAKQRAIIEGFGYLPFEGRIVMKGAEEEFVVFEEWEGLSSDMLRVLNSGAGRREALSNGVGAVDGVSMGKATSASTVEVNGDDNEATSMLLSRKPKRLFFGRHIGSSQRHLIEKHDLKKRPYISTTSMDAELALVTATLAKASPGKFFLDPFTGTGGFMIAAAELGAVVLGADIDGRSFRGKGQGLEKGIGANLKRYGLQGLFGDCLTSDLTNSPLRLPGKPDAKSVRWLDGIICDPPYGVREGLKVLGRRVHDATPDEAGNDQNGAASRRAFHNGPFFVDGVPSHTLPGFIAPKRPYSFNRMLEDILDFAARMLVDGGRLAFWMPCANEAEEEFAIPRHGMLELKHACVQAFNKWSRRLLVYERISGEYEDLLASGVVGLALSSSASGHKADDLNQFRRMYFKGFADESSSPTHKNDHG